VVLTWHVDYWDRLGWKDPFARKEFTERQRRYQRARGERQVWTPQFLVDGEIVATGAAGGLPGRVERAAKAPAPAALGAAAELADGRIAVRVSLCPAEAGWKPAPDLRVTPVLYRREARTAVPRGENEGRTLVESFIALDLAGPFPASDLLGDRKATATFALPQGLTAVDVGVALLLEDAAAARPIQCATVPVREAKAAGK